MGTQTPQPVLYVSDYLRQLQQTYCQQAEDEITEGHDQAIGLAEKAFLRTVGWLDEDPAKDEAWQQFHLAVQAMWRDIAIASFSIGMSVGASGEHNQWQQLFAPQPMRKQVCK